ncbi:MAG: TonB-dependent receptor [Burkholderiaceae bacterium]|nr:TonB-dependent receptor [Burkholderiaceae bacterium]
MPHALFRRHALALAAGTALTAPALQAQTPAQAPAEVVIQGQRASLIKAQDIKRSAEQIVDSIVADDIGKLPDANVAEALQRISGVQISRSRGEGDRVQVRGLQQTQTLLNGRVIFSAGKERGLSFQDMPSELLAGADVYKTPTASLIDGGIGGTIDLRTRRPFDFAGLKLAGTLKASHADLVDKTQPQGSVLLSNRWKLDGGGEFGALLSLSTQKRSYRADAQELDNPAALADGSGIFAPTGQWLAYEFGERERHGLAGSLQWRPNARTELALDLHQTRLKSRTDIQGHYASPFWANWSATANQGQLWNDGAVQTDGKGRFVSGTFWGASMSTSASVADENTATNQIALSGKWQGDGITVRSELSHTRSEFERFYQEVRLGTWADSPAQYHFDLSTSLPSAHSPTAQLSDLGHYWADKLLYFKVRNEGRETAWRADADWGVDGGLFHRLQTGLRLSQRRADSAEINTIDDIWMFNVADIRQIGLTRQNDLLQTAGSGNIPRQWLTVNDPAWLRDAAAVRGSFNLAVPAFDPQQTFDFRERSIALYGSADLETTLAGKPLTGNLGLRAVSTRTERATRSGSTAQQIDSSDTDWLPALNLRWELQRDLLARVALSRVVTRPHFDQLTPSLSLNANDRTGYQGNPALKPLHASQLDLSLERYLSKSDHVYAAAFFKKVDGFIQTTSRQVDIVGTNYTLSTPSNGSDGRISGLEIGYQGFFHQLPGLWRGLGLQANVTLVDSSAPSPLGGGRKAPLEGLSRQSANLVGMYDLGPLSARLAYNWRSDYSIGPRLHYPSNDGKTALTPVTMQGYGVVDAYLSWAFSPRLKLALEANNLTRTVRRSQFSDYGLARGTYVDDRRVGVSLHAEL